jgi:hypothetical protein
MSQKPAAHERLIVSVRSRLFNVAKAQGRDFGAVLRLFFLEADQSGTHRPPPRR